MVSKALVVAAYRSKITELKRMGVQVTAMAPPVWVEGGNRQVFERSDVAAGDIVISPMRFNGHFHLHYYPELRHLLRQYRPDLVHIDEEPYNLATFMGVKACQQLDIPTLFFSWQNLRRRYPPPFRQMEEFAYERVEHALAGSQQAAVVLREKGYKKPLTIVPQFGIDPDVFHPAIKTPGPFTIGFLNRLIPAKAPLLMLDALRLLPDTIHLRFVGDGPLLAELERQIERLSLSTRVRLDRRVPSSQMPELMCDLDVVVLPSLTTPRWKEQFGRVLIEAMSCGVPVVGSDSGEIPEVIGDAGIVVPEGDATALAAAISALCDNPQLRREFAERGRQRVLDRYTQQRVAETTCQAYTQVLASRTAGVA